MGNKRSEINHGGSSIDGFVPSEESFLRSMQR